MRVIKRVVRNAAKKIRTMFSYGSPFDLQSRTLPGQYENRE